MLILKNICTENSNNLWVLQELGIFQDSLTTLKMAKTKFAASKEALEQFKDGWENKTTLIPLTGSM